MSVINVTPDVLHQLEILASLNEASVEATFNGLIDYYFTNRAEFEEPQDPEERAALMEALREEKEDPTTYSQEEVMQMVRELLEEHKRQKRGAA